MALPEAEVERIAYLARIEVPPEERPGLARELSRILDLFAALAEVATDGVEPMAHPMDLAQRMRPDEACEGDERERFQAIAPQVEAGLYLVPKVID